MNKEQAIEILKRIQEEKNHDDIKNAKQFLKNLTSDTDRDFDEDYINSIKKYIETAEEELQALDIAIESLDNEWVDVRDRLPEQPYDKIMRRPALRTKPMLVSVNGDDWMKDKLYGTKNATYNQVVLAYYSFRDNCWEYDDDDEEIKRDGGINSCEVIAWKPLPQPYERKE